MSNSKHTPGPWAFGQNTHGEFLLNGKPISAADSLVLSAAPEMLEALEVALEHLPEYVETPLWLRKIESVIAKARGES